MDRKLTKLSLGRNNFKNIYQDVLCHSYEKCGLKRAEMAMICTWTANLPNSPWAGIIKSFLPRESLASYVPPGDEKLKNLFLQCGAELIVRDRGA